MDSARPFRPELANLPVMAVVFSVAEVAVRQQSVEQ
jgi:hypothetical protein